jgi:hypothetical protein
VVWSFIYLALRRSLELILLYSRRQRPRRSRSWCYATSWRCCAASTPGPGCSPPTECCSWRSAGCCHGHAGRCSWCSQRRCCAGTGAWWPVAGHYPTTHQGRPALPDDIQQLIVRLARENPRWGYQRIHGELLRCGVRVSASSIRRVLRAHGLDPAPRRAQASWRAFLRHRPPGSWPATFSPSTRSSYSVCMCAVRNRTRKPTGAPCRRHRSSDWVVGRPAGPQPGRHPRRAGRGLDVPDPRPGRQVHQGVRRRVALDRGRGDLRARPRPTPTPSLSAGSGRPAGSAWTSC